MADIFTEKHELVISVYGDLPKSCEECIFCSFNQRFCRLTQRESPNFKFKDALCAYCKELPPHGRLIDADALIERTKNWYCSKENCEDNYNGIRCRACWVDDAIGIIDDANVVVEANNE